MHHYTVYLQDKYAKYLKKHPELSDKAFTDNYRGGLKVMVRGKPRYEGDVYPSDEECYKKSLMKRRNRDALQEPEKGVVVSMEDDELRVAERRSNHLSREEFQPSVRLVHACAMTQMRRSLKDLKMQVRTLQTEIAHHGPVEVPDKPVD